MVQQHAVHGEELSGDAKIRVATYALPCGRLHCESTGRLHVRLAGITVRGDGWSMRQRRL